MNKYDVIVIGSGPGGEKAAIQAAKLNKKVILIEKEPYLGGTGLRTGTIPSKTLREAAIYIAGLKQRVIYGFHSTIGKKTTLSELMHRKDEVIQKQMEVVCDYFNRNDVGIIYGKAKLIDEKRVLVSSSRGDIEYLADVIIIATGSSPFQPMDITFDGKNIYDSNTILELDTIPSSLTIVGGGVIGCEYACIFSCLGVKVTIIEKRDSILDFVDGEIISNLAYWMRNSGIVLRLNETVKNIEIEKPGRVNVILDSGKTVHSEKLLYTLGRVGNSKDLNLESVGIKSNDRGIIEVDEMFETCVPGIYAVGDVIGPPALAATSMDQGRKASCNAFSVECSISGNPINNPIGIYTIPEISKVGETEEALTKKGVPYEIGQAFFHEVARGQIIGDIHGMLKLIFHRETKKLLGVHIIGEKATEIIHIGQVVMDFNGTIDYFIESVFNYPTLSCAYKAAALNGLNRL